MRTPRPVLPLLARVLVAALAAAALVPAAPVAFAQEATPALAADRPARVSLSLTPSVTAVVAGQAVTVTGTAVDEAGAPAVGEVLELVARTGGTQNRVVVGSLTTGATGAGSVAWTPRTSSELVLRRTGCTEGAPVRRGLDLTRTKRACVPSESTGTVVHVSPRLTAGVSPAIVPVGAAGTVRGTLVPAYFGVRLQVQRRLGDGSWVRAGEVGTTTSGAYSFAWRTSTPGRYVFRTVLAASMAHRGAVTPAVALQVVTDPTLRQGDRGPAVATLEARLAAQKADIGPRDGVFDSDLRHGLTAWQKSQGLPRTGVYDATTRARLAAPAPVRLRYPAAGRAVEVDITKQVLYLSQGGVLQRIVDISSGNGEPYTVDGQTYLATTPLGRFRIERKIDGIRVSRLGELYRPAYFYRGWAVHGSPSVPTYPASHGCVRVTNSAQDRLFPLLTIGTPVAVYRS